MRLSYNLKNYITMNFDTYTRPYKKHKIVIAYMDGVPFIAIHVIPIKIDRWGWVQEYSFYAKTNLTEEDIKATYKPGKYLGSN